MGKVIYSAKSAKVRLLGDDGRPYGPTITCKEWTLTSGDRLESLFELWQSGGFHAIREYLN